MYICVYLFYMHWSNSLTNPTVHSSEVGGNVTVWWCDTCLVLAVLPYSITGDRLASWFIWSVRLVALVTISATSHAPACWPSTCLLRDKYNCCARDVTVSYSFDTGVLRRVSLFCYWLSADFADILSSSDIRGYVAALITTNVGYRNIISSSILRSDFIRKLKTFSRRVILIPHTLYTRSTLTGNGKWWRR